MSKITFHIDPGHGWLEVPVKELRRLKILDRISPYSFVSRDGRTAYLEEDCDASLYVQAAGLEWSGVQERFSNEESPIRDLPRLVDMLERKRMSRDAWSGIHHALHPEPDCGGAFDGFTVTSDADPGL